MSTAKVKAAREMLAAGIEIQALGEATNSVMDGVLTTLFERIDELEAALQPFAEIASPPQSLATEVAVARAVLA